MSSVCGTTISFVNLIVNPLGVSHLQGGHWVMITTLCLDSMRLTTWHGTDLRISDYNIQNVLTKFV